MPGKHIVYEKRLPNTVEGEWALDDMRGFCGCRLQTLSGEHWIFKGGDHSHTLMWCKGKRLEARVCLALFGRAEEQGRKPSRERCAPTMSPGNYVLLRQVGDRNPLHCRQPFNSCLWRLKSSEHTYTHLSQGELMLSCNSPCPKMRRKTRKEETV